MEIFRFIITEIDFALKRRSYIYIAIVAFAISMFARCNDEEATRYLVNIYITPYEPIIMVDSTTQFTIGYYPDNCNTGIPNDKPVWTSSNEEVATVNQDGVLQGVSIGETTISVTWGDFSASTLVVVDKRITSSSDVLMSLLLRDFDKNGDGELQGAEISSVTQLNLRDLQSMVPDTVAVSMKAVSYFSNLKTLVMYKINASDMDFSKNTKLEELDCSQCYFERLDVSKCTKLKNLDCHNCSNLERLRLGSMSEFDDSLSIVILNCSNCQLEQLELDRCHKLEYLNCSNNSLTSIDLSNCTLITQLSYYNNDNPTLTFPPDFDMSQLKIFE